MGFFGPDLTNEGAQDNFKKAYEDGSKLMKHLKTLDESKHFPVEEEEKKQALEKFTQEAKKLADSVQDSIKTVNDMFGW